MGRIGAQSHRPTEVAVGRALFDLVALHPLRHQADHRMFGRPELARGRVLDAEQVASRLDHRHLHAEADAEERYLALAREPDGVDLALGPALSETAGHQDSIHVLEVTD